MPVANVTIELMALSGIDAAHTQNATADTPYLVATIGHRFIGRSAALASGATSFDFTTNAGRWQLKTRVETRDEFPAYVPITIELWADRGADPPQRLLQLAGPVAISPDTSGQTETTVRATSGSASAQVRTTVVSLSASPVRAPRGGAGATPTTAVVSPPTSPVALVDISAIATIHEPGTPASQAANEQRFSRERSADFGRDDGGRVYLNRQPDGTWLSRQQYIDLTATIRMAHGALPSDAKILWTVRVPDDPIAEHPQVRIEALRHMRSPHRDSDFSSSLTEQGPRWPGNQGKVVPSQVFEQLEGFTLSDAGQTSAKTIIQSQASRVRLHCPSRAGDRFLVEATVVSGETLTVLEAATGMLTMWHRIDTDYRPLEGAFSLSDALGSVNAGLAPCCVQFDFTEHPPLPVPSPSYAARAGGRAPRAFNDAEHLSHTDAGVDPASTLFAADSTMFPHVGQPGWFTLGAALMPNPVELPPPGASSLLWRGETRLVHVGAAEGVILPAGVSVRDARAVKLSWGGQWLTFRVTSARQLQVVDAGATSPRQGHVLLLGRQDLTQLFHSADGSIARYQRREQLFGPSSYSLSGTVEAQLLTVAPYTSGISPAAPRDTDHFAGRLVIFTRHSRYSNRATPPRPVADFTAAISNTIAHEFGHSLGSPHKCGHWAFRHDGRDSCTMNYGTHAVRRDNAFIPGSVARGGSSFCGLHISQLRNVLLQDNPIFGRRNW